jgi:hypothetical protein
MRRRSPRPAARRLLKALLPLLAIGLVAGFLAGCGGDDKKAADPKTDTKNPASVSASFTDYAAAVNAKNGDLSADLMSASSRAYYDRLRDLALDASKAVLQKSAVIDQITILSMRAELDPAVLRSADPRALVSTMVQKNLISQNSSAGMSLQGITISGAVAKAKLVQQGEAASTVSYPVTFALEDARWRFDVTSLLGPAEAVVAKAAKLNKMSDAVLVQTVMDTRLGAKAKTMWTPIGR